jgi:hypothetical protein
MTRLRYNDLPSMSGRLAGDSHFCNGPQLDGRRSTQRRHDFTRGEPKGRPPQSFVRRVEEIGRSGARVRGNDICGRVGFGTASAWHRRKGARTPAGAKQWIKTTSAGVGSSNFTCVGRRVRRWTGAGSREFSHRSHHSEGGEERNGMPSRGLPRPALDAAHKTKSVHPFAC